MMSFSLLYEKIHSLNDLKTTEAMVQAVREENAQEVHAMALELARASLTLCHSSKAQTYIHDAVYGLPQLVLLLGKPYLGSTEANESAHQEMKHYFHHLVSHSSRSSGDVLQVMNLMYLKRWVVDKYADLAKPTCESAARLGLPRPEQAGTRTRKDGDAAIGLADDHLRGTKSGLEAEMKR